MNEFPAPLLADASTLASFFTFAGGALVAVCGAYVVHFLTHDRWWREYRLRKLEELYNALAVYQIGIEEYYTRSAAFLALPSDSPNLQEQERTLRELYLPELREKERGATVIPMIIEIYFPNLLPPWDDFLLAKEKLTQTHSKGTIWSKEKRDSLTTQDKERIGKEISIAVLTIHLPEVIRTSREIEHQIAREGATIQSEKPWPIGWLAKFWERLSES